MTLHRTEVRTGDPSVEWSRLVDDLQRCGLLGGPGTFDLGAFDAVARVGADVLARADVEKGQTDAP